MPHSSARLRIRRLTWAGLAIALLGSAPLLAIIAASKFGIMHDRNPNPVGFGILAGLTFWPGLIIAAIGGALSVADFRRARSLPDR